MQLKSFDFFHLPKPLKQALAVKNYKTPTPIQEAAIPVILAGHDLVGCAQTGSGKTLAFVLPALARCLEDDGLVLVLVPTRELAQQVRLAVSEVAKYVPGFKVAAIVGGKSFGSQASE